jgi:hypothetical protein
VVKTNLVVNTHTFYFSERQKLFPFITYIVFVLAQNVDVPSSEGFVHHFIIIYKSIMHKSTYSIHKFNIMMIVFAVFYFLITRLPAFILYLLLLLLFYKYLYTVLRLLIVCHVLRSTKVSLAFN